jgi:NAD-dependent dihydropyrimidine dehydrogenase PreA subunit
MSERHGVFIAVEVDDAVARDPAAAARLEAACPVDIYGRDAQGSMIIVEANLDECILCGLCLEVGPPGAVRVRKLYDEGPDAVLVKPD